MPSETQQLTDGDADVDDEQLYTEIRRFLFDEASKIDNKEFEDWLGMMTEDIQYQVPTRVTTAEGGRSEFPDDMMNHIDDNRFRLEKRIERLQTEHAWAEQPPSRTRHLVSNIRVTDYDPDERRATVRSALLLHINRGGFTINDNVDEMTVLTGERDDELVKIDGEWKLDDRVVYLDHEVIPAVKLSVFI